MYNYNDTRKESILEVSERDVSSLPCTKLHVTSRLKSWPRSSLVIYLHYRYALKRLRLRINLMDSPGDWTASALFSPSKARAQQAQAKDWAAVDAWLAKKYASIRLPTFERNEESLQALLTLANLNENADEQRTQIERVQKAALQILPERRNGAEDEVLHLLLEHFGDETHIDALAEATVALECKSPDILGIGERLVELSTRKFEESQLLERTELQLQALKTEHIRMEQLLAELKSDMFQPSDVEDSMEWAKSAKHLKAKLTEYDERLNASRPKSSHVVNLDRIQQQVQDIRRSHANLDGLDYNLKAFESLPSDARSARAKLEAARNHLYELTETRSKLFENMIDEN